MVSIFSPETAKIFPPKAPEISAVTDTECVACLGREEAKPQANLVRVNGCLDAGHGVRQIRLLQPGHCLRGELHLESSQRIVELAGL